MQTLKPPNLLLFRPLKPHKTLTKLQNPNPKPTPSWHLPLLTTLPSFSAPKAFSSDEFPVDESFLESFGAKEKESEDEARKRNWVERGWAPWEEILTPEADFARKSLNEGEEVPLKTPEAIEAFKMLSPKYRQKKMEESGLSEDEYLAKQFAIQGEIMEPLQTTWSGPLVLRHLPPRDWPPRDWEVDEEELAFIREAHKLQAVRVDLEAVESSSQNTDDMCLERYQVFLKQYKEWVAANRDRLEKESYEEDQDYHPGRRKRGKDYNEDMLELPFYCPGQICAGKVTTLHLYQGAFVDIGGVYDGWVPIKGNDWYWIRQHIKVGMHVIVEILAKRDPYRFRFPIEMRFVSPNIDHLIFNRFDLPPIFHRDEDTNPDELRLNKKLRKEAEERGEEFKVSKLRRNIEMDDYDFIHWRRSYEEREALLRDISCRQALGLPLEEPGRYVDDSYFGKDRYDPDSSLYRYDYWGEPKNSEKSKQERMTDAHNKSIVGKGNVWYEMSYEEAIKQRMKREAQSKGTKPKEYDTETDNNDDDIEDESDDDDDFDYSILGNSISSSSNQPVVNGTESSRLSDEGMFEN